MTVKNAISFNETFFSPNQIARGAISYWKPISRSNLIAFFQKCNQNINEKTEINLFFHFFVKRHWIKRIKKNHFKTWYTMFSLTHSFRRTDLSKCVNINLAIFIRRGLWLCQWIWAALIPKQLRKKWKNAFFYHFLKIPNKNNEMFLIISVN